MKLDRNINANGRGKYALLKLRRLDDAVAPGSSWYTARDDINKALKLLEAAGILDWGNTIDSEFMVIRLKDRYAPSALHAYAVHASNDDPEYAGEIMDMCRRSGSSHPNCKKPD